VRPAMALRGAVALAYMAVLGPLVFYALWPWIWHDTVLRVREYVSFHLNHEYYNMELFGRNYWQPPMPRSYAWVMTAATVPTITLVLCGIGATRAVKQLVARRSRNTGAETELLWLLAVAISYAPWLSPKTPIFGGTKHWLTAYPFVALLAGA